MQFTYLNHRGKEELRDVTPTALVYLVMPSKINPHLRDYQPGWFLECVTHDRGGEIRHFALDLIRRGPPVSTPGDDDATQEGTQPTAEYDTRLPLAHGMTMYNGTPFVPSSTEAIDYAAGYQTAQRSGPFEFYKSAAWTVGYNDGRRATLGKRAHF